MSYSHDGDSLANDCEVAIYELIEAFKATGDPYFMYEVNPAPIRWLNEELNKLGYKIIKIDDE